MGYNDLGHPIDGSLGVEALDVAILGQQNPALWIGEVALRFCPRAPCSAEPAACRSSCVQPPCAPLRPLPGGAPLLRRPPWFRPQARPWPGGSSPAASGCRPPNRAV